MVDPLSAIAGAVIAGATVAAQDTTQQVVKDAYTGLKTLLVNGYKLASIHLLEKEPTNPAFQDAVKAEIKNVPAVIDDKAVLESTQELQLSLQALPPIYLNGIGYVGDQLKSDSDIILERISGTSAGAVIKTVDAKGSIRISDVHGGTSEKK